MRWNAVGWMLVLAGVLLAGCKQKCCAPECDVAHYASLGLTPELECTPANCLPPLVPGTPPPATVDNPERAPRYITLMECIAMALENGVVGREIFAFSDPYNDLSVSFAGGRINGSNAIRVLALDPAILATDIEAALAKFDVRWRTSLTWDNTDRPVGTALETFEASRTAVNAIQLQDARFSTGLVKPLPTGGVAGITFNTDYQLSNLDPRVNPSYRPALAFHFQQPLLRSFGVDINQLLPVHPNLASNTAGLAAFPGLSKQVEGILIARINFDQQRIEFERLVQIMVANVEVAYWNLYYSYAQLYSREQALRQAYEAWRINKARYEAGRIPVQELAQSRGQYELFRGQRLAALGGGPSGGLGQLGGIGVLERERQLRAMIGLPPEDGTRLIPVDTPTITPYRPDWNSALQEAMELRPEILLARNDVKQKQLLLIREKNLLLPDLRFVSSYDYNAIGNRIDGGGVSNAFRNLADGKFSNWSLGLQLEMPIGFRNEHAAARAARLELARSLNVLRDIERRTELFLTQAYRNVSFWYEQISIQRAQREAYAVQLDARFKEFQQGRGTLDFLLEAQRNWADALRSEYEAIVEYNKSLMGFEYAKGTILNYNNIQIAEGPLPRCAVARAVEHERERARAIVCKERAAPVRCPRVCVEGGEILGPPELPEDGVPSVPALLEGAGPPPNDAQPLPPVSRFSNLAATPSADGWGRHEP